MGCPSQDWSQRLDSLHIVKILHIQSKIFTYAEWYMMKGKIPLLIT